MDNRFIKASTLKSIADAIRAKKGTNSPLAVADFAEEIKNLVVGGSSSVTVPCRIPHVYHTESVEALPNDAIDGSLAVVETTSDTFIFNKTITNFYKDGDGDEASITLNFKGYDSYNFGNEYNRLAFNGETMVFGRGGPTTTAYWFGSNYWANEQCKIITITKMPTDEDELAWLNANGGNKVTTIYSRQNGEWVSEHEVDFGKCYEPHIIEVAELPTENIDEIALYKIGDAYYQYVEGEWEGIGAGGGSSECSGNHIIKVDELPTEGIEGAIYKLNQTFSDVVLSMASYGTVVSLAETAQAEEGMTATFNTIPTKTTENIQASDGVSTYHCYYIENEGNVFLYTEGEWCAMSEMFELPFIGCISDISEATEDGLYAIGGASYYRYIDSAWEKMILEKDIVLPPPPVVQENKTVIPTAYPQTVTPSYGYDYLAQVTVDPIPSNYASVSGSKTIASNGTHDVRNYESAEVSIPTIYLCIKQSDLPKDAPSGSIAYNLKGGS